MNPLQIKNQIRVIAAMQRLEKHILKKCRYCDIVLKNEMELKKLINHLKGHKEVDVEEIEQIERMIK